MVLISACGVYIPRRQPYLARKNAPDRSTGDKDKFLMIKRMIIISLARLFSCFRMTAAALRELKYSASVNSSNAERLL